MVVRWRLAFHAGVLWALHHDLGWDPPTADIIVGTSAGSETASTMGFNMMDRPRAGSLMRQAFLGATVQLDLSAAAMLREAPLRPGLSGNLILEPMV